jgi:hypothetical protein
MELLVIRLKKVSIRESFLAISKEIKMLFNLIKKFSSWLDYWIWRQELKRKIKRNKNG